MLLQNEISCHLTTLSQSCINTDGKSLPAISLVDKWCDFETLLKIQIYVIDSKETKENFQLSQQHDQHGFCDNLKIRCFTPTRKNSADFII